MNILKNEINAIVPQQEATKQLGIYFKKKKKKTVAI